MSRLDRFKPLRGAHRQRGRRGEQIAEKYLTSQGHRVLGRNVRNRFGELDLVTRDPAGVLVFVEVKAGTAHDRYRPEMHVTPAKQRKLIALAAQFARRHELTQNLMRFDVIAVEFPAAGEPIVRHHPGAFTSMV
jgi:putative endonuclease